MTRTRDEQIEEFVDATGKQVCKGRADYPVSTYRAYVNYHLNEAETRVSDPLNAKIAALEKALAEVSINDDFNVKPDFHSNAVDQLAFELACMCEDAELYANDLVIVNREKLKTIARRVISRAAIAGEDRG